MEKRISTSEKIYCQEEGAFLLFEKIQKRDYLVQKVLKDSSRSYVALLKLDSKQYIYKQPREKNTRKWQRFLSYFRGSESRREGLQMQEIENNLFLGPKFRYAYEKKRFGMVFDSYLLYDYIEGKEATQADATKVLDCLQHIHQKGFLHGDSQISNFLCKEDAVYLIDSKFHRNHYGALGRAYEIYYLELSCPDITLEVDRSTLSYNIAKAWKEIKEYWVKRKTRRREKK